MRASKSILDNNAAFDAAQQTTDTLTYIASYMQE
jgi:hypothetical protein